VAAVSRVVPAPPDRVWAALANGWTYARWVVGTSAIRAVDPDFPAEQTRLHYRIGHRPLAKQGGTAVLRQVPGERLELEAEGWPLGTVYIELTLTPEDPAPGEYDGAVNGSAWTRVTIVEHPRRGLAGKLHNPLLDLTVWARNLETLRRLEKVVLGRP